MVVQALNANGIDKMFASYLIVRPEDVVDVTYDMLQIVNWHAFTDFSKDTLARPWALASHESRHSCFQEIFTKPINFCRGHSLSLGSQNESGFLHRLRGSASMSDPRLDFTCPSISFHLLRLEFYWQKFP